ncbi:VOC family protein [Clavibacter sp. VKM Ac-2542]|uniref:VOC family protein n=1 Tax=Clavibacter sp. VKM Ac-2542 TaxID=2783811 RepID=UPI00188AAF2C|nr:VOC family protein [Clavibacter sp. VKM Ac-2542]MBF4620287.1 VOC family protein [Clavibacter sp. VKM Ac-2542]
MGRILSIGGLLFRAYDPVALAAWYRDVLGLDLDAEGVWQQEAGPTVVAAMARSAQPSGESEQRLMLDLRVSDLDGLVARLAAAGAEVAPGIEDMPGVGRFSWVTDPEGSRIELWEPS